MKPLSAITRYVPVLSLDHLNCLSIRTHQQRFSILVVAAQIAGMFAGFARASTIVGIWTESQVTIAADSRRTFTAVPGATPEIRQACKIYPVRDFYVAMSGTIQGKDISIIDFIRNGTDVESSAQDALAAILKSDNLAYDPNAAVSILIARRMEGRLAMEKILIKAIPPEPIPGQSAPRFSTTIFKYPDMLDKGPAGYGRPVTIIGFSEAIARFIKIIPDEWSIGSDVVVAKRLIAVEASDSKNSAFVGPPISVLVLDKNGARWADRGVCTWNPE